MNNKWNPRSPEDLAHLPPPEVFEQQEWKDRLRTITKACDLHTVPLWGRKTPNETDPEIKGSGLLLEIAGSHFLVTAAHVAGLGLSLRKRRDTMDFLLLPAIPRYALLDPPIDIAALPLPADFVKEMDPTFHFASLSTLDPSDRLVPQPAPYIAFGYLSDLSRPGAINYQTYSMYYFSSKFMGDGSVVPGYSDVTQLALELQDRRTTDLDGFTKVLPELGGMSGSGMWRAEEPPGTAIHLVGITTRWHRSPPLVVGTQVELLLAMIATAHPELRRSIEVHVGTTWARPGFTLRLRLRA